MNVTADILKVMIAQEPTPDLSRNERDILAKRVVDSINAYAIGAYSKPFRWHLGASVIGDKCDRKLYLTFHWAKAEVKNGRMLRLWERGNLEELRYEEYLKGAGFTVQSIDPSTGKQFRVSYHHGHFGGSSDGVLKFPTEWNIPGFYQPEYKTSGTGAKFNNLEKQGVETHIERHFVQQSVYGYAYKMKYGVYLAVNKNDDDLYCEVTELSVPKAEMAIRRGGNIITSDYVPAMMPGAKESYFECKMCDYHGICHKGEKLAVNCRSCVYSKPVANAEWHCDKYGQDIPREFVPNGCPDHKALM